MNHNKKLRELLLGLHKLAVKAKSENDFGKIFDKARIFQKNEGPIQYDHSRKWKLFFYSLPFFIFTLVLNTLLFFNIQTTNSYLDKLLSNNAIWIMIGLGTSLTLIAIPLILIANANSKIDEISDIIFDKDIRFDNNLTLIRIHDKIALYEKLSESFGEFRDRGNEDQRINKMMHGLYQGSEFLLEYDYYIFHYVEVYYVPVTYSNGKTSYTRMEKRTRTLYRYGLLHDFNLLKNVAVVSSGGNYNYPKEWQTASKEFNDIFSVYADNEMTASKFLKPTVIIAFIELAKHFDEINLEINNEGKLNIAFSDDDVLELERKYSIASPDEFEKEINSMLKLPKLTKLLEFIEILKKFNDDNF